jgi:hypothetical protein
MSGIKFVELSCKEETGVLKANEFTDWDALVKYMSTHHIRTGKKDEQPAFSLVSYIPGEVRGNRGIDTVNAATFDFDHMQEEELLENILRLKEVPYVMSSTASDNPVGGDRCFRVVLPLDKPVSRTTWRRKWQSIVDQYGLIKADTKTSDPARIFFIPTARLDGTGTVYTGDGKGTLTDVQKVLLSVKSEKTKRLAGRIACGAPLARPGHRNATINEAAWLLRALFPQASDAELHSIITPSLKAMESGKGGVEEELAVFQRNVDAQRVRKPELDAEQQQQGEDISAAFAPEAQPPGLPKVAAPTKYTAEATKGFHPQHWIVQKDASYFFRNPEGYTGPFGSESAESAMHQELRMSGLRLESVSQKGIRKKFTTKEMIASNGVVAHHLEGSLDAPHSYFDESTMTFTEAIAPLRNISPVQHTEVNDWLVAMGGSKADQLLDWVASVTKLKHQCAGLLLEGDAGSGKTLLANGLASLWSTSGPSPFDVIASDFNSSLKTCPLVFADEGFTVPRNGNVNDILRRAIASPSIHLRRKFISDVTVKGAIRVMMATNDENILKDFKDVGADARDALAERILLIGIHDGKARAILSGMPHEDKAIWKELMIAEHALWLRDNRVVKHGKRFIVEGVGTEITDRLSVSAGVAPDMLEFIVYTVKVGKSTDVVVGGGKLFVSANLFKKVNGVAFENATGNNKLPSTYLANQTLSNISSGEVKIKGRTFFDIKLNFLSAWNKTARSDNYNDVMAEVMK